jgi:hypothetical protein
MIATRGRSGYAKGDRDKDALFQQRCKAAIYRLVNDVRTHLHGDVRLQWKRGYGALHAVYYVVVAVTTTMGNPD